MMRLEKRRESVTVMKMAQPDKKEIPPWHAYGPEKEAWKAAGNYYTAEDLKRMAEDFRSLTISSADEPIYDAN